MKLQYILKYFVPAMMSLVVAALEHDKSFLIRETASPVWAIGLYEHSLLLTVSSDIVQKDIQTGAIQRTFRAHKKTIRSFVVTGDSRMISSAYDDMIIVWNLETGSILKRIWLRSSDTLVTSLYLQDDQVFTGGYDNKVRQTDLASGRVVKTIPLTGIINCVTAIAEFLYVGKDLGSYVVKLNIARGDIILRFDGHTATVFSLFAWNSFLFSSSADTSIICWNAVNGDMIRRYIGHEDIVISVAVFDGQLYSASSGRGALKWNINDGTITKLFSLAHTAEIYCMAYKSHTLFTGSFDTKVVKWDAITGQDLFRYSGRQSIIRNVASWKNFVISGGEDAEIRIWDASIDSIDPFVVLDSVSWSVSALLVFEDLLYFAEVLGDIKTVSMANHTLIRTLTIPRDYILDLAKNKLSLYGGAYYGSIYEWSISSGTQIAFISAHTIFITSLRLQNDLLYSGSFDGTIKAWNTKSFERVFDIPTLGLINAILTQQDFLFACTTVSIEKFSLNSGEMIEFLDETSTCFCLLSRENILYSGHEDSTIQVRDSISLISIGAYAGHVDTVASLCFDGVFNLYSTGYDGTIKKWNEASRSVAFSFENRNGSVSSLAAYQNELYVGLKSGRVDFYTIDDGLYLNSVKYHSKEVTSLIVRKGSIYSCGLDGTILRFFPTNDRNFATIYRSNLEPMKDLSLGSSFWISLQGNAKILYSPIVLNSESLNVIEFQTPLVCVAAADSVILAGSILGIIYAWNYENLKLDFELKGHVSPVNILLVVYDLLFSASDDKTIIEWSLESKTTSKSYKRLSTSSLGHLGPVQSLSYCSETLFSSGSDLTVRRWNTNTGKHEDVYFGFAKSVTSVLCHNGSVFAGSEDFSVLMFKPSLPQNQDLTVKPSAIIETSYSKKKKTVRLQTAQGVTMNVSLVLVSVFALMVAIILVIFGFLYLKQKSTKIVSRPYQRTSVQETETAKAVLDLETVVNSVMGISKHAAYLVDNSSLAKVKKIAAGGGGELFLAKVMDPKLRKKMPETVVQKIVFVKNKISEEAFYQEVGIMIMLSSFPNFCQIIGYTESPLSMILKNYHHGSLDDWLGKNKYGAKIFIKIMKETASSLNTMHSHYLAHCDLKPQNILVELDYGIPSCFLTDFGITQILSEKIIATKAFQIINLRGLSLHYAAPEALRNFRTKKYVRVDFKAYDIYSFGCVMLEVLNRKMPWV